LLKFVAVRMQHFAFRNPDRFKWAVGLRAHFSAFCYSVAWHWTTCR